MEARSGKTIGFVGFTLLLMSCAANRGARGALSNSATSQTEADALRSTERTRLRALVDANMDVARALHAPDFQLINPGGVALSKDEYLGFVQSGKVDYLFWEPDTIAVRMDGNLAVLRYRSQLEIVVFGSHHPRVPVWHTDVYEKRASGWQVVWSQATEVKP